MFPSHSIVFKYVKLVQYKGLRWIVSSYIYVPFALEIQILALRKCHESELLIQIIFFITNFDSNHSGLGERIPVSHQNFKSLKNRARCLNIFRLLCFMLTYSKALAWFCSSFILQSLIFYWSIFQHFGCGLCHFFLSGYDTLCLTNCSYWELIFYASGKAHVNFFSNLALVFWKRWH